jgi:hypothetical protein
VHGTGRDNPSTLAANVDAIGEIASTITERLTLGLLKEDVITIARGLRHRLIRKSVLAAKPLKCRNAIRGTGVSVKIDNDESGFPKLDGGNGFGINPPPFADLRGVHGCGDLPSADGRSFVELPGLLIPRDYRRKNRDTCCRECEGGGLVCFGAHGSPSMRQV